MTLAAVVIGRNEGARLLACLDSLQGVAAPIVYVDSGSTDGSVAAAAARGAEVVTLDMSRPFTAARARTAGLARLAAMDGPDLVQMIDGDCTLQPGWAEAALTHLADHPQAAMVAGRLRERHPDASLWNRLADDEWDTAIGDVAAVGGIAVLRRSAVKAVGGYRETLIAGEEPELCLRLRREGWSVWRLDRDMALHDIAMTRVSQWWRRARRHGHAVAEGAALHGAGPERFGVTERRRALIWGAALPIAALLGLWLTPWALVLLLAWPAQMVRLRLRGEPWRQAIFLTLAKLPEAQGVLGYMLGRLRRRQAAIIEYK